MRDWIVGLQKGASERGEGVDPSRWGELEATVGRSIPAELRDLYEAMDGAQLPPEVELFRFDAPEADSVVGRSRQAHPELASGAWIFGRAQDQGVLFCARKEDLALGEDRPEWLDTVGTGGCVYCWRRGDGSTRFYRTLEQLLTRLVPPAETEEVGDITYARALSAVQGALDLLGVDGEEDEETPPAGNGASGPISLVTTEAKSERARPERAAKSPAAKKQPAKAKKRPVAKKKVKAKAKKKVKARKPKKAKASRRPAAKRRPAKKPARRSR